MRHLKKSLHVVFLGPHLVMRRHFGDLRQAPTFSGAVGRSPETAPVSGRSTRVDGWLFSMARSVTKARLIEGLFS